ncbi:MAG: tRNA lysidine(34) synthetase TilS [Proteobacteria bacterium]|nr:tRNA lysidine(34) synthetase TilS [Pseudomonadota bacterium]
MVLNNLLKKIQKYIESYNLLKRNQKNKVVLALSGGPDSIFLLYILFILREEFNLEIFPVHINHMIRSSSYEESIWLKEYVKNKFGLDTYIFSVNVISLTKKWKKGIEETGRIVRKKILNFTCNRLNADFIALGHNLDDQVETVLFRMIRGSGIKGMSAMKPKDGNIIRPLIFIKKSEILNELRKENLLFISDATNEDTTFTRNMIRHNLIPLFDKVNINAKEHIFDLSSDLWELNNFLEKIVNDLIDKYILLQHEEFDVYSADFLREDKYIVSEMLRKMYSKISGTSLEIERKHINDFYSNALENGSYSCFLPKRIFLSKSCDVVVFSKKKDFFENFCIQVSNSETIELPLIGNIEVDMDINLNNVTLEIRNFQPGDRYRGKKLKEFYLEKRVPLFFRKAIPLIAEGSNVIHNFLFDGEKTELVREDQKASFIFHPSELYCKIKHFLV